MSRLKHSFKLYDVVRIDHFRGFDEYFSIPFESKTARDGRWEKGPGMELFDRIRQELGDCNVIAEDLGLMTDGVRRLVKESGFPNMKVIQFAFDVNDCGGTNEYLPHNYDNNCVVYTGTHDNETAAGWLASIPEKQRELVRIYLNDPKLTERELYRALINLALMSCARICIIPIQDYLGLDNSCRMNQPGTVGKNWRWRLTPNQLTAETGERLLALAKRYGRTNWDALSR